MADANARRTKSIVTFANGVSMRGDVICGPSGRLESVVYDPCEFFEFHPDEGMPKFIAKRHVLSVEAERVARQQAA